MRARTSATRSPVLVLGWSSPTGAPIVAFQRSPPSLEAPAGYEDLGVCAIP